MMLQEFLLKLSTEPRTTKNLSWSYVTAMVHGCCKKKSRSCLSIIGGVNFLNKIPFGTETFEATKR